MTRFKRHPYHICEGRAEAEKLQVRHAEKLTRQGLGKVLGVYIGPVETKKPHGFWGLYLVDRRSESTPY